MGYDVPKSRSVTRYQRVNEVAQGNPALCSACDGGSLLSNLMSNQMRGIVCCLVALLVSSCIQSTGEPERVVVYRSKLVTGDKAIPTRYGPYQPLVPGEAFLQVGSDDTVMFVLTTDEGVSSSRLLTVEGTKPPIDPMRPRNHLVLTTSERHPFRGFSVNDVVSVTTTVIHFYRDKPIKAVVFVEYVAEFDVKTALENIDLSDEQTKQMADWFATFDELNTKRQRTVIKF